MFDHLAYMLEPFCKNEYAHLFEYINYEEFRLESGL